MSHRKFEHPRHGSLGFLPRKRAARHRGKGIVRFLVCINQSILILFLIGVHLCIFNLAFSFLNKILTLKNFH